MAVSWTYTPPNIDGAAVITAAAEHGVQAAAEAVLEESNRLVPRDTGALAGSGEVTRDGLEATISYGKADGAGRNGQDTADYAIPQHERLDFEHQVGQAKFLETAMHSSAERVAEVLAEVVRRAVDG